MSVVETSCSNILMMDKVLNCHSKAIDKWLSSYKWLSSSRFLWYLNLLTFRMLQLSNFLVVSLMFGMYFSCPRDTYNPTLAGYLSEWIELVINAKSAKVRKADDLLSLVSHVNPICNALFIQIILLLSDNLLLEHTVL